MKNQTIFHLVRMVFPGMFTHSVIVLEKDT